MAGLNGYSGNMNRGDIYRVAGPGRDDPKKHRFFVVVSRQAVIHSTYSTVVCAPVYSRDNELSTQVAVGSAQGFKHDCAIHCDGLVSIAKSRLTHFVSALPAGKVQELEQALRIALALEGD